MASLLREIGRQEVLLVMGGMLVIVGVFFWNLPRVFKSMLSFRQGYAERLRVAGEERRAAKVDAETAIIVRRIPIYGKVMVICGVAIVAAPFFIAR